MLEKPEQQGTVGECQDLWVASRTCKQSPASSLQKNLGAQSHSQEDINSAKAWMNLEAEPSLDENSQAETFAAACEALGSRPFTVPTLSTQENCEIKHVCSFKLLNF